MGQKEAKQMAEEMKQMRLNQGIVDHRTLTLRPQGVIDWLPQQHEVPTPLFNSTDTMML
jgi:hypothetical protein